MAYITGVKYY